MVTPLRLSSTLKHLSRSEASCGGCRLWSAADAADVPRAETFARRIFSLRSESWSPGLCVSGRRGDRRGALPLPPNVNVRQQGRVRGPKERLSRQSLDLLRKRRPLWNPSG